MPETKEIYKELLSQIGSSREVNQYLNAFSSVDSSRFAIIKVGGGVLRDNLNELASALAFLHRLGLRPIVLHGAGPQVDAALTRNNIECVKDDNLRVTTEEVMAVARPIIYELNLKLVGALEKRGIRARGLQHGTFKAKFLDEERFGLVGEVTGVNTDILTQAIDANALPVLTCLGETNSGQVLNINADIATRELVWAIKPRKIIFLTPSGGILDGNDCMIASISLNNNYDELMQSSWLHSGMRLKLQQINEMMQKLDSSTSVSITSANHLTRELFTHKGAGTLIRKGEKVILHESPSSEIIKNTVSIIEASFGKKLQSSWINSLIKPHILLSTSQRAAAVIVEGKDGIPYLDKFMVTPEGQGEGLGSIIWQAICQHYPQIYWRSRIKNPINSWYFKKSDACERHGEWTIFMMNIADKDIRANIVTDALARNAGWEIQSGAEK